MAPRTENLWWLGAILWLFVMGAVAINVFLAGLILASAGWPSIARHLGRCGLGAQPDPQG